MLYKGTITRLIGEDSPGRAEKVREDALPKGHVIYEGKKGHVLSYDGKLESSLGFLGGQGGASGSCTNVWELACLGKHYEAYLACILFLVPE